MTAAWMWAGAELRARWRAWVVLGLLAGATAGIVAAGVAGARRTVNAVPSYLAAGGGGIDAAVLANDPSFDAERRAEVAALPEVRRAYPFSVAFVVNATKPRGLDGTLLPHTAATARLAEPVVIKGRHTDPRSANEAVIDENIARKYGLDIGSTIGIAQRIPPGSSPSELPPGFVPPGFGSFHERLRVVGITKSIGSEESWSPSSGLWTKHKDQIVGVTNMFVALRHGEAHFDQFQRDVQRIVGHPVNVERGPELLGFEKDIDITNVERDGLLLFAFAALVGGGVLVGQALVRAVTAAGADVDTWRAMGADRTLAVRGMALPTLLTAAVAVVTTVIIALAISPQFPIGVARRFDLDLGLHLDALVVGIALIVLVLVIGAVGAASAWWRVSRGEAEHSVNSTAARWATNAGMPPALLVGSRLAVEPGRGRRAVPVRSAMVGAIVGVIGVVACFTFRVGIADAAENPRRSGIVWDFLVANGPGTVASSDRATIASDRAAGAVTRALWDRAIPINGVPTSTLGIASLRGSMPLVVVRGRAPRTASEIAFAPTTADTLHAQVGDTVRVGDAGRPMKVVGIALLPSTSHTGYDQSAWITIPALHAALGSDAVVQRPSDFEDYLLIRWRKGADVAAAERRVSKLGDYSSQRATVPTGVVDLGNLATMPLVLAVFFALLAAATVAHALVTTVRRRRFDLAVLRSIGFTRQQSRLAIAWQATLLAAIGLLVGVPLGLVAGRLVWRWLAEGFPLAYVPPIELIVVLLVIPIALLIAQALAAGPAHAATRIQPAVTLRAE